MVKDKKTKALFLGGAFLMFGLSMNLLAQTPPVATPAAPAAVAIQKTVAMLAAPEPAAVAIQKPVAMLAAQKPVTAPAEVVVIEAPKMPEVAPVDNSWKPALPAVDAKVGTWKLVDVGAANAALKLKKIAVGDINDVWAAGDDGKIYRLTPKGWEMKTTGVDVAATEDDTVLVVNEKDELLSLNKKGEWVAIPGVKAKTVAAGNSDAIWVIHQGQVFHFDDGKWEKVKNMLGQDAKGLPVFAVNAEEVVYALDDKNQIYRRDLDRVEQVQKTATLVTQVTEKKKAAKSKPKKVVASKGKAVSAKSKAVASKRKAFTPKGAKSKPPVRRVTRSGGNPYSAGKAMRPAGSPKVAPKVEEKRVALDVGNPLAGHAPAATPVAAKK